MRRVARRTHVAVALAAAAALLAGPPAQARPPVQTDPVVERLLAGVGERRDRHGARHPARGRGRQDLRAGAR